jgi:hypothetical protein
MKQLLIGGVVTMGLVTAMMGTAQSSSTYQPSEPPSQPSETCTYTVWICGGNTECEFDGASSAGCESECALGITSAQARMACLGCCAGLCTASSPQACPD